MSPEGHAMVMDNRRLALWFINRFCAGFKETHPSYVEDLEQELMIGLCRAVHEYEPAKGSFSNYAIWWMRSRVTHWRKTLPVSHGRKLMAGINDPEYGSDVELEYFRALLETLTPDERELFPCTREGNKTRKQTGMSQAVHKNKREKVIRRLKGEHIC